MNFIQGDIRFHEPLYNAMCGHDVVIHAAAVKRIPEAEWDSVDCIDINVAGSQNVCFSAIRANVQHVLGISTDKACHPANAYGATKMLMEKIFQEYARFEHVHTSFHLVRYGNVIESTGSVVEAWRNAVARGEAVKITDENMTRFWLSPSQAVDYVVESLEFEQGLIYVPKMKSLSIGKLLEYALGKDLEDVTVQKIPLRPGEKAHETLVTLEELERTESLDDYFIVFPSTAQHESQRNLTIPYTSASADELTRDELEVLLNG
jgi:UDP-N-acetylglucosamine 4,6-dehydratase